jgi:hypothetical protein
MQTLQTEMIDDRSTIILTMKSHVDEFGRIFPIRINFPNRKIFLEVEMRCIDKVLTKIMHDFIT